MNNLKFRAWHEQGFMLDIENIVKLNLNEVTFDEINKESDEVYW